MYRCVMRNALGPMVVILAALVSACGPPPPKPVPPEQASPDAAAAGVVDAEVPAVPDADGAEPESKANNPEHDF